MVEAYGIFSEAVYVVDKWVMTEAQFEEMLELLADTPRKQAACRRAAKRQVREYDVIFDSVYDERSIFGTQRHYNEIIHDWH